MAQRPTTLRWQRLSRSGKALRKSCVLVKDAPAFVVNRLLTRFLGEVMASVDEGTSHEVAEAAVAPLGLPLSPFVLLQLVGPAVAHHVAETMHAAYPDRFGVSDNLGRIVAAGKPGVYSWDDKGRPFIDDETRALIQQGDAPQTADELRVRALDALAEEVRLMLDEGVVAEVQDIDLCLLLGAGWPFHLGGITPYLDRTGTSESVTGARFLPRGVASPALTAPLAQCRIWNCCSQAVAPPLQPGLAEPEGLAQRRLQHRLLLGRRGRLAHPRGERLQLGLAVAVLDVGAHQEAGRVAGRDRG